MPLPNGAGRKAGTPNKKTQELHEMAASLEREASGLVQTAKEKRAYAAMIGRIRGTGWVKVEKITPKLDKLYIVRRVFTGKYSTRRKEVPVLARWVQTGWKHN